jgi:hypothetical protein
MLGVFRRFRVGEQVTLSWRESGKSARRTSVRGTVVRCELRPARMHSSCPFMLGIAFDQPLVRSPFARLSSSQVLESAAASA